MIEPSKESENTSIRVAIVGGGIVGAALAIGLLQRGIGVAIYERAATWPKVGAGIGFPEVCREAMRRLSPEIIEALQKVGMPNPNPHCGYYDGQRADRTGVDQLQDPLLFRIPTKTMGYWACSRDDFILAMSKLIPEDMVHFGKELKSFDDDETQDSVTLHFADGMIGCDGIKSRTRQILLGETNQASRAHFAHRVAYRALVPLRDAVDALGERALNQSFYLGPNAYFIGYPLPNLTQFNVVIHVADENPWLHEGKLIAPGSRDEIVQLFKEWRPEIRKIVDLLPDQLLKWAIFDTMDHPAPTYSSGRVAVAGDAAHACTPDHGIGAGMGMEDAMVLATVLQAALATLRGGTVDREKKPAILTSALQAFNAVRYPRSQWLVRDSRELGNVHMFSHPLTGCDPDKCKAEVENRQQEATNLDVEKMASDSEAEYLRQVAHLV